MFSSRRIGVFLPACAILAASTAFAQLPVPESDKLPIQSTGPAAPPEVDAALRERVTGFFQCHVDGNFRKAMNEYVADDAQDFYLGGHKSRYQSFRIDKILYTENFTKAKVYLTTEVLWEIRMQKQVAKVTTTGAFKLQNGKWYWYDDPQDRQPTPMGKSDITALTRNPDGTVQIPRDFSPEALAKQAASITAVTSVDKSEIVFVPGKAAVDTVKLHNGAPGYVNVELIQGAPVPGIKIELDKKQLGPNQDGFLKISYEPGEKIPEPFKVTLTIEPFNRVFDVTIRFAAPAE